MFPYLKKIGILTNGWTAWKINMGIMKMHILYFKVHFLILWFIHIKGSEQLFPPCFVEIVGAISGQPNILQPAKIINGMFQGSCLKDWFWAAFSGDPGAFRSNH